MIRNILLTNMLFMVLPIEQLSNIYKNSRPITLNLKEFAKRLRKMERKNGVYRVISSHQSKEFVDTLYWSRYLFQYKLIHLSFFFLKLFLFLRLSSQRFQETTLIGYFYKRLLTSMSILLMKSINLLFEKRTRDL